MNAEASKCPNGKDRYVVINNEIIKRLDNGQLEISASSAPFQKLTESNINNRSGHQSPAVKPKNVIGGNQVTPVK